MKNSTPARSINYPSDLTDTEWEIVSSIITEADPYTTGRPRISDLREILNAIYYLNKTGCPWRYLPNNFPDYKSRQLLLYPSYLKNRLTLPR